MQFTYQGYRDLIMQLQQHNYKSVSYHNWQTEPRCVILRHDIDMDIEKALRFAGLEQEMGVTSTYFVLVTGEFYNIFARRNQEMLKEILALGHDIGLHYDERNYPETSGDFDKITERILREAKLLEEVIEMPVTTVSMHWPSQGILESDLRIPGMINSYGKEYFKGFKYLSDSRHHWREPVQQIIESEQYEKLHILTHAIWYHEKDKNIHDAIEGYVNAANLERYDILDRNMLNLSEAMKREEVR